jgi:hypothetical protein
MPLLLELTNRFPLDYRHFAPTALANLPTRVSPTLQLSPCLARHSTTKAGRRRCGFCIKSFAIPYASHSEAHKKQNGRAHNEPGRCEFVLTDF